MYLETVYPKLTHTHNHKDIYIERERERERSGWFIHVHRPYIQPQPVFIKVAYIQVHLWTDYHTTGDQFRNIFVLLRTVNKTLYWLFLVFSGLLKCVKLQNGWVCKVSIGTSGSVYLGLSMCALFLLHVMLSASLHGAPTYFCFYQLGF